jgi:hypothetical protein
MIHNELLNCRNVALSKFILDELGQGEESRRESDLERGDL